MRRPVRSHVANRRMFQGGGLSPLPQPTGILASSQPLVDQIAQNAVNPAGNVMMNQGGFANGGWNSIFGLEKLASGERQTYNVEDNWKGLGLNDRLNNTYNTNMKFSDFVRKNYADATVPSFTFAGEYAPAKGFSLRPKTPEESIYKLVNETLDQSTVRMGFNRPGETFEEHYPVVEEALAEGKPYSNVGTAIRKQFSELYNITVPVKNLAKGLWDTFAFNFSSAQGDDPTNYVPDYKDVALFRVVMQMGRERQDLAPQIEKAAKNIISENPNITPIDLQHEIVRELTNMEKVGTHGGDGVTKVLEHFSRASLVDTLHPPPEPGTEAERLRERAQDPESMAKMMAALNAPPGDPGSEVGEDDVVIADRLRNVLGKRLLVEQNQRKLLESKGQGDKYVMSDEMRRFQDQQKKGQDPYKTTGGEGFDQPGYEVDALKVKEEAAEVVTDGAGEEKIVTDAVAEEKIVTDGVAKEKLTNIEEVTKILQGVEEPPPEAVPVIEKIKVDASNNDLKQTTKTLEEYRDDFVKAMPKYEGMSKEEQGFAWIKMGMAIAAGQSPNAIENISKGVLATIDEFADDPKQKRLYKKQVEVSAAKYALENVRADTTFAQGLLAAEQKDNRAIKEYMVHKGFTYGEKTYEQGDLFVTTVGELQGGVIRPAPTRINHYRKRFGIDVRKCRA